MGSLAEHPFLLLPPKPTSLSPEDGCSDFFLCCLSCPPRYAQPGAPNCRPGVSGDGPSLPGVYFPGSHPPSGHPQHQEDEAGTEGLLGGTWGRADLPWGEGAQGTIQWEDGPWGAPTGLRQRPKHPERERPWTRWCPVCPHTLAQVGRSWAWGPVDPLAVIAAPQPREGLPCPASFRPAGLCSVWGFRPGTWQGSRVSHRGLRVACNCLSEGG